MPFDVKNKPKVAIYLFGGMLVSFLTPFAAAKWTLNKNGRSSGIF